MDTIIADLRNKDGDYKKYIETASEILKNGGLVIFPTETVYGLGANALDSVPCGKVFDAKGRPHDNPLIVHIAFPDEYSKYAYKDDFGIYEKIAKRFMPGPITCILKKKDCISSEVTVGLDTVAIRCPSNPIAHDILASSGLPIAAPSANLSGKPSPTSFSHVYDDMFGRVDMIINGGECEVGLESTVIAIDNGGIRLLRPGYVTAEELSEICKVTIDDAVLNALSKDAKPASPGMKYRHYAPEMPVTMIFGEEEKVIAFFNEKIKQGCGILCFDEDIEKLFPSENVIAFGSKMNYLSQANKLFDSLRKFDKLKVPAVYARFTDRNELALAVSNRLLRACAFNIEEIK